MTPRNTWSGDHGSSAKPAAKPSGKARKALFGGLRKPGFRFVISRSPVQVRPVAPASEIPPHGSEKAVAQKAAAFSSAVFRVSSFSPCNPLRWACMGSPVLSPYGSENPIAFGGRVFFDCAPSFLLSPSKPAPVETQAPACVLMIPIAQLIIFVSCGANHDPRTSKWASREADPFLSFFLYPCVRKASASRTVLLR